VLLSHEIVVDRNGSETTIKTPVNLIGQIVEENQKLALALRIPFVVTGAEETSVNKDVLRVKDIVTHIDNKELKYVDELPALLQNYKGQTVSARVLRENQPLDVELTVNQEGKIGIAYAGMLGLSDLEKLGLYKVEREHYGFFESIPIGIDKGFERLGSYWNQLKKIVNPSTGAYKGVGGFKAIFDIFPQTWSWEAFWNI